MDENTIKKKAKKIRMKYMEIEEPFLGKQYCLYDSDGSEYIRSSSQEAIIACIEYLTQNMEYLK